MNTASTTPKDQVTGSSRTSHNRVVPGSGLSARAGINAASMASNLVLMTRAMVNASSQPAAVLGGGDHNSADKAPSTRVQTSI